MVDCFEEVKQMPNEESKRQPAAGVDDLLEHAKAELTQVHARIGPHFRRAEASERAASCRDYWLPSNARMGGSWQKNSESADHAACSGSWGKPTGMPTRSARSCGGMCWSI